MTTVGGDIHPPFTGGVFADLDLEIVELGDIVEWMVALIDPTGFIALNLPGHVHSHLQGLGIFGGANRDADATRGIGGSGVEIVAVGVGGAGGGETHGFTRFGW